MIYNKKILCLFALLLYVSIVSAVVVQEEGIKIDTLPSKRAGTFRVMKIENCKDVNVTILLVDGATRKTIYLNPKENYKGDITCDAVYVKARGGNPIRLPFSKGPQVLLSNVKWEPFASEETVPAVTPSLPSVEESSQPAVDTTTMIKLRNDYYSYLDNEVPFYSSAEIQKENQTIDDLIDNLHNRTDKQAYIQKLEEYIKTQKDTLHWYERQDSLINANFWKKFGRQTGLEQTYCLKMLEPLIRDKQRLRETSLEKLQKSIDEAKTPPAEVDNHSINWKYIGTCVGLGLLFLILLLWFFMANRRQKKLKTPSTPYQQSVGYNDTPGIVVRNTTTTVLKKQSLEDVYNNEAYMKIDAQDFCSDSAVKTIYFKNSCIKEIYQMYAEDLRNPDNPKEDGCMVLGRWVLNDETKQYDVSLEQIVLPGDDAVFSEYELNFGGKIKLKVSERLRRLRRETNLQYDLICWVHSHPGLGVFFSSSDNNVHMQLDHPSHSGSLTAIVVDILTPNQELGFFTFRTDQTINSKSDLTRMYSLEEIYKWAVRSERGTFKSEDYYNTLSDVKQHTDECYGVELSNSAIIDMAALAVEQTNGFVGMVHGYSLQRSGRNEHIIANVSKTEEDPGNELIGCFVIASHCSIPSVRKAVAQHMDKIQFVLVYTASDGLITSIPVIGKELSDSEDYYGEQKLEDLKIWTRRKR